MLAVADEPAIRARMHSMSVEAYHQLGEAGVLGERTELIRGAIIDQMPRSPLHTSIVQRLDRHLLTMLPEGCCVRPQEPLTFSDSEPEPDIAIVSGSIDDYVETHPHSALVVMEVCVTSEDLDRIKLGVYAGAGIPECWLLLAEAGTLERHTEPVHGTYQRVMRATSPETAESTALPGIKLFPNQLFPTQASLK
jgi:Uma2 family endonuclease